MSHTYSESPGRALSHGATQFMSYICKKMSKSRFRDPSEQGFLRFSELGSPDYIVKSAIFSVWVFLMISVHGNTLYAIAIHKNRSITSFLTRWSHFENRTKKTLSILQLLRTYRMILDPDVCRYDECVYDAYIYGPWPLILMHACMMHIFMILNNWPLIQMHVHMMQLHVCMMHISIIFDPDACVYDACVCDPWSWCICVGFTYVWCT